MARQRVRTTLTNQRLEFVGELACAPESLFLCKPPPQAVFLYLYLEWRSRKAHARWPSHRAISKQTGLKALDVHFSLQWLAERGYIVATATLGEPTDYRIVSVLPTYISQSETASHKTLDNAKFLLQSPSGFKYCPSQMLTPQEVGLECPVLDNTPTGGR